MNKRIILMIILTLASLQIIKAGNLNELLFEAVQAGDVEPVQLLLAAGADVTATDKGFTPLQVATANGHAKIVKLLLAAGANVNAVDGDILLQTMNEQLKAGHKESSAELYQWVLDKGFTPLHSAAITGHTAKVVELLLAEGADVNVVDKKTGWTPLHGAAFEGHSEVVKLLLAKGADVNAAKVLGHTPLELAAKEGYVEVAALLLDMGTKNINAVDWKFGFTPLHWAAERGHARVVELLINSGADMKAKSKAKRTPLNIAARFGNTEVVELLIESGADSEGYCCYGKRCHGIPYGTCCKGLYEIGDCLGFVIEQFLQGITRGYSGQG